MKTPRASSLFARTALLIAATLLAFTLVAWQATMWTVVVPAADLSAEVLTQRANAAINAHLNGSKLPEGSRFDVGEPNALKGNLGTFAYGVYLTNVCRGLQRSLNATAVVPTRLHAPSEIWVKTPAVSDAWLILTWRIGGPRAPAAAIVVLILAALLVLGVSAWSARRLASPLAKLASAAGRVAEGESVAVDILFGPAEVRALARAFQSMAQRLGELESQRELLLAGVSHDLRSPLARMRVAIELLDGQEAALVASMLTDIDEMDRMIGQFLHYARAGYREMPASASLDQLLHQALASYASDERVMIECQATPAEPLAVESLKQIVLNLTQNALEYGQAPVTIRGVLEADTVVLRVEDAGAGVPDDLWQQALKPFSRLSQSPGVGHAGLGLALVARLVQASRGVLTIERSPGSFAVVVRLPRTKG